MILDEKFQEIKALDKGEVVMKLPGTDIILPYSEGSAFVNEKGTIGYNALKVREVLTRATGEAEGLVGAFGKHLAEQLNDPNVKELIKEMMASEDTYLFFSKIKDGKDILTMDILTMPNMNNNCVDDQNIEGVIVGVYSTSGSLSSLEKVYEFHLQVIADRDLITDRAPLEKEVLKLVPKVNEVYEKELELMKEFGL